MNSIKRSAIGVTSVALQSAESDALSATPRASDSSAPSVGDSYEGLKKANAAQAVTRKPTMPMHPEVEWYIDAWSKWTTPEAIATHPRFNQYAEQYEAAGSGLRQEGAAAAAFLCDVAEDGGARAREFVLALSVTPHPNFVERLGLEISALDESIRTTLRALQAKEPTRQLWQECLQVLDVQVLNLREVHNRLVRGPSTYGDLLSVIPLYTMLATAEVHLKQQTDDGTAKGSSRVDHIFGTLCLFGADGYKHWLQGHTAGIIVGAAPARMMFPSFSSYGIEDFPALPVWPVGLARGPQSFDGRRNKTPSEYAEHDIRHVHYLAPNKIWRRGGRRFAGHSADTAVERRELSVLVRTAHREEALRQFWLRAIRQVPEPLTRKMLQLALFVIIHETESGNAPTRLAMIQAVDRLCEAIRGPSLTDGTGITVDNVNAVAVQATEWLKKVKIRKQ